MIRGRTIQQRPPRPIRPMADVLPLRPAVLTGFSFPAGWRAETPRQRRMWVIRQVASAHGVDVSELLGRCRDREVCLARWEAMATIRARFSDSLLMIGRLFGRDHTSVMHGLRRFEEIRNAR